MSSYFIDTSSLAKNYVNEKGTPWIKKLVDVNTGNIIVVCDLTPVEMFSVLAKEVRKNQITAPNAKILQTRFLSDLTQTYLSIALGDKVLRQARDLIGRYKLRSLDSIQLASAIEAQNVLGTALIFVSSDKDLLTAATGEGFSTDDPRNHP